MAYTLKSNATTALAELVWVGDNVATLGHVNLVDSSAVTAVGTLATGTWDGHVSYGDGAAFGNYLSATLAAIPSGTTYCYLIVGHVGKDPSTTAGGRIVQSPDAGTRLWTLTPASTRIFQATDAAAGDTPYLGPAFSPNSFPSSTVYSVIGGRTAAGKQSTIANGTEVARNTNDAYVLNHAVSAGAWKFGGSPGTATNQEAQFGVTLFAVFVGLDQNELAAYIAANGTGSTEGEKAFTALLDAPSGTAPSITSQPSNASVSAGATATFTAAASGSPAPTYQWQRNPGGVGSWADIASATSASYTTPATTVSGGAANDGDTYRVVATNASGSATSTAATLTVSASNAAPTFPGPSISNLSISQGVAMTAVNVASKFSDTDALTFSAIGTWPAGVTVSSAGVISGTPTVVGNYTGLTVRATDTAAQTVNSNSFSITVTAVTATLNFQAAGMEFGARTGLGISTFALDVGSGYRYTVHADGLTLGAALYTSGVVTTDSAGKLPNLVDASITAGVTYRVHAVRQSDGAAATFKVVAA